LFREDQDTSLANQPSQFLALPMTARRRQSLQALLLAALLLVASCGRSSSGAAAAAGGAALQQVQEAPEPQHKKPLSSGSDFEKELVREAVDLHAAHTPEQTDEAKSMVKKKRCPASFLVAAVGASVVQCPGSTGTSHRRSSTPRKTHTPPTAQPLAGEPPALGNRAQRPGCACGARRSRGGERAGGGGEGVPGAQGARERGVHACARACGGRAGGGCCRFLAGASRARAPTPSRLFQTRTPCNVTQLYDAVSSQPTEADLMTKAIRALTAAGASEAAQLDALAELQRLVEPLDNANGGWTVGD